MYKRARARRRNVARFLIGCSHLSSDTKMHTRTHIFIIIIHIYIFMSPQHFTI